MGVQGLEKSGGFKTAAAENGKESHTCSRDSREEDCEKATRTVNGRSVPFTSVAH